MEDDITGDEIEVSGLKSGVLRSGLVQVIDGSEVAASLSPRASLRMPLRMPRSRDQLLPGAPAI